jgi:DNA-binding CsgD family transcriptional regulator
MARERTRSRCLERLELLAGAGLELSELRLETIGVLRATIGFDRWCTLLLDPDTLVLGQGIGSNDWSAELPRLNILGADQDDLNNHMVLARSRSRVGVLSAATGGELARSRKWDEILSAYGVGDELRCVAADEHGPWADFLFFRDSDDAAFDADDAQLMRDASSLLASALRRAAVGHIGVTSPAPSAETGVLLLDAALRPCGSTDSARAWFAALNPAGTPYPDAIPGLVWNVVGRLLAIERGQDAGRPPRVRVRAGDGPWAIVEAARLDGADGTMAVTVRQAGVEDVLGLLGRATGLSPRERELVALLVEGLDTRELAARLFISRHTVQDHLKSVFDKVGVRSRRELVSGVFAQSA